MVESLRRDAWLHNYSFRPRASYVVSWLDYCNSVLHGSSTNFTTSTYAAPSSCCFSVDCWLNWDIRDHWSRDSRGCIYELHWLGLITECHAIAAQTSDLSFYIGPSCNQWSSAVYIGTSSYLTAYWLPPLSTYTYRYHKLRFRPFIRKAWPDCSAIKYPWFRLIERFLLLHQIRRGTVTRWH